MAALPQQNTRRKSQKFTKLFPGDSNHIFRVLGCKSSQISRSTSKKSFKNTVSKLSVFGAILVIPNFEISYFSFITATVTYLLRYGDFFFRNWLGVTLIQSFK